MASGNKGNICKIFLTVLMLQEIRISVKIFYRRNDTKNGRIFFSPIFETKMRYNEQVISEKFFIEEMIRKMDENFLVQFLRRKCDIMNK